MRRLLAEKDIDPASVKGTGKGGRVTKEDVEQYLKAAPVSSAPKAAAVAVVEPSIAQGERTEKRVHMTRLRKTIATRLLQDKNDTAMLTTLNEVKTITYTNPTLPTNLHVSIDGFREFTLIQS